MKLKYRGGSALNSLVTKMRNGGSNPIDFGEVSDRSKVDQGLASSANPQRGYGQGANVIPPKFDEFFAQFKTQNPDLFDRTKQQYVMDGKKVYYPNTPEGFEKFRDDRHMSDSQDGGAGSYSYDVFHGLMNDFDNYIQGFEGNIENMDEAQIKRLRDKYQERARSVANTMERG
tara:strand:+ start:1784 stop:2302 length:519 start_codon:yes stop_codon:yes gene_type:complete